MDNATLAQLRTFYESRPFKPFELILDDGKRLLVDEPYYIGWSVDRGMIVWSNEEDTFDEINMKRVAAVRLVTRRRKRRATRRPRREGR
jgi:hypothetical protein